MLSDDELPPLPNKEKLHTVLPDDYRYGHIYGYTADQMREYARAVERAAYAKAEKLRRDISNSCDTAGADMAAASASVCADAISALGRQ